MVSSVQSPTPSPSRRREGRLPGHGGGAFGLFRRRKKTSNAFSRNNRKFNTNDDIATPPKEGDAEDDTSCSSVEKMISKATANNVGVEARIDSSSTHEQINDLAQIVHTVEKTIRQVFLYCLVFVAGTESSADIVPKVGKLLELSAVAWATCLVIVFWGWMQSRRHKENMHHCRQSVMPSAMSTSYGADDSQITVPRPIEMDLDSSSAREDEEGVVLSNQRKQRNYFENLYIMLGPNQRVYPNGVAVDVETEIFYGKMLLMFRTPEADSLEPSENPIVNYFRGKQRRFEFQWQFKLKKIPHGDVFFCAELDEPVQMGRIQRALTSTALKFVKKMNQGFSFFISESNDCPSYLSFPVGTSMDRFTATKRGEPLPELGKEIVEDRDTMKERKKGKKIEWNVDDVYTMAIWSAYLDWVDWQLMNFPGIPKLAVTSVAGVQPIKLTLFTTPGVSDSVAGKDVKRHIVFNMEVSNAIKSTLGKDAKEWVAAGGKAEEIVSIQLPELDVDEKSTDMAQICMTGTFDEDSEDSASDGDTSDEEEEDIDVEEINEAMDTNVDNASTYLCSGSHVILRESIGSFLSSGGGYAVLQSSSTNSIILEKIHTKRKFAKSAISEQNLSMIIRNGDVVMVKLVDASNKGMRYLTLHRGWWLRWSSSRPQKNGYFCIRTNDCEGTPISLDLPFSLQSRKWSRYLVGAMQSSSAKYGGRMLGLYKAGPLIDHLEPELDDDLDITQHDEMDNRGDKGMIMPLLLCANAFDASRDVSPEKKRRTHILTRQETSEEDDSSFHEKQESESRRYKLDVPVYIEMMNRTNRTKQRVYAVRAKEYNATDGNDENVFKGKVVMKLRTGHSLASVLRIGLNDVGDKSEMRTSDLAFPASVEAGLDEDSDTSSSESESDDESQSSNFLIAGPNHFDVTFLSESDDANAKASQAAEQGVELTPGAQMSEDASPDNFASFQSSTPGNQSDTYLSGTSISKRKKGIKHAVVLGKVAKTLKSSTVVTGKHVIKHSKNIGKGTVNAGRAAGRKLPVSSVVHSKPPKKHEPTGRVNRKKSESHVKALVKAMKRFDGPSSSGQLLTPDKYVRKVSHLLSEISSLASLPSVRTIEAITTLVNTNSQSDLAFLRGGSAELGVVPLETIDVDFDCEFVVARSIWEGRWREEVCALYSKGGHLSFYAPLTKKPSLVVSFDEIISVRKCDPDPEANPLPGLNILAVDTAWRCHYLAFLEATGLESFSSKLRSSLFHRKELTQQNKAREWETFQLSLESALTGTIGPKWASVSTGRKSHLKKQRRVLNGRRMSFDLKPVPDSTGGNITSGIALYVANLLEMALVFSPDTLDATEASFIEFLDEASRLRSLPLHEIDFTSRDALCIFVNLYHCLLQHSLLIAVDGLPDKRSATQFKRRSCYEIGDDVFSLSELECLVIRGKTSRPSRITLPFVAAPKKSKAYIIYALDATDYRINFLLNNGDIHYPASVPVLREQTMDDQIDAACQNFLLHQVEIDTQKTTVVLPKVCDVYKNDFGDGDVIVCLSQCLRYLDVGDQLSIADLLENGMVSVKFRSPTDQFHTHLTSLDTSYAFSP